MLTDVVREPADKVKVRLELIIIIISSSCQKKLINHETMIDLSIYLSRYLHVSMHAYVRACMTRSLYLYSKVGGPCETKLHGGSMLIKCLCSDSCFTLHPPSCS